MMWTLVLVSTAALVLSGATTQWLMARAARGWGAFDQPNARSLHTSPIPRTGGVAVLIGAVVPLLAVLLIGADAMAPELIGLSAALALVAGISLLDDVRQVPPLMRLLVHGAAAGLLLNGGMAVSGFSALALLSWQGGDPLLTLLAASIAAAALGFLTGNVPPARIFLGDVGAASLGLLAAGLSLWGSQREVFPLWAAALAFSPFIVDATWTLVTRLQRGERLWEAHRSHHYQRLVLAGWSRRDTLLRSYALMTAAALSAVAAPRLPTAEQWLLLTAWATLYVLIHQRVALVERSPTDN